MIRRTLGTLTDTDVKERRTITLAGGNLTGRLRAKGTLCGRVWVEVDCGLNVVVTTFTLPAETPVEVRS